MPSSLCCTPIIFALDHIPKSLSTPCFVTLKPNIYTPQPIKWKWASLPSGKVQTLVAFVVAFVCVVFGNFMGSNSNMPLAFHPAWCSESVSSTRHKLIKQMDIPANKKGLTYCLLAHP